MSTLAAVILTCAIELALNALLLAFALGRLSERVHVLWLAVFNHLGQDAESVRHEYRQIRRKSRRA